MIKALTFIALMVVVTVSRADWSYIDKIDPFTDERVQFAVYDDPKHRIQLSREGEEKDIWMFITRKDIGTIEPDGIVDLRVDKNDARDIVPKDLKTLTRLTGRLTYQWEPKTVGFLLWIGETNKAGKCGYLDELLTGNKLLVRYQTNSMQREIFEVSLKGSKEAINNGLGLVKCGR